MKARKSEATERFARALARRPRNPEPRYADPKARQIARSPISRVLAIDPGYDRCGIAVVEGDPSRPTLLMSGCVVPAAGARATRLARVSQAVTSAIKKYRPNSLAIETLFFSINKKTAIGVAEARGAILAAAGAAALPVLECSPQQVKSAVTGYGNADKAAIARMIPKLLALPRPPAGKKRLDDELDAIAIGITALARSH